MKYCLLLLAKLASVSSFHIKDYVCMYPLYLYVYVDIAFIWLEKGIFIWGESFKSLDNGLLESSLLLVTAAQTSVGPNVWQYTIFHCDVLH